MTSDQFGNFLAGYQAEQYELNETSLVPALTIAELFGIYYHNKDGGKWTKAKYDPLDKTGIPDIKKGADYAKKQYKKCP